MEEVRREGLEGYSLEVRGQGEASERTELKRRIVVDDRRYGHKRITGRRWVILYSRNSVLKPDKV